MIKTETYGTELRKVRKELGLSQKQLAKIIGVTSATVSNFERGVVTLDKRRYRTFVELVNANGVNTDKTAFAEMSDGKYRKKREAYLVGRFLSEDTEDTSAPKLSQIRRDAKLTQHELAKKLGVTYSLISKYEHGVLIPPDIRIKEMAAIFDVPEISLLAGATLTLAQKIS